MDLLRLCCARMARGTRCGYHIDFAALREPVTVAIGQALHGVPLQCGMCPRAEFTGFEEQTGPLNLPRDSDRIWRGSYKGKDWRYLVQCPRNLYWTV